MARLLDFPPSHILTFPQIVVIALQMPNSILEIQDIMVGDSIFTF
jgi:uncharacterized protein with ACT and thioredoxin-like domain